MATLSQPTIDVEKELADFEAKERARLGISDRSRAQWADSMINPQFHKKDRPTTTLLVCGLTMAHDYLVEGALKGIGYQVRMLDCPDNDALRYGKEFGNRAQCNPTYFTVGNLVKELTRLRDKEGISADDIIKGNVFLTAGACGPCRFGMYVTEYRKALRDAGFEGFRVMLFQQQAGFAQATGEELGLELNPLFFMSLAKALLAGDIINGITYRIRPYEVVPGAADRACKAAKDEVYKALVERTNILVALWRARRHFAAVKVDRTNAKPKASIIGEFWAMTTEGDGNYQLQRFLESEGAECDIQFVTAWILYNIWEGRHDTLDRLNLKGADGGKLGLKGTEIGRNLAVLWFADKITRLVFQTFANVGGLHGYKLPDMDEIARIGHSHYNNNLRGGEGHMEVAKLILNVVHQKAHMTVSVKPFGCMPSSGVSDGVQTIITERYPETIFCAVETSGDGAVNFYSRVQMFLFKARQRAQEEMQATLKQYGVTREEVQAYLERSYAGRTLFKAPHVVAGSGADVVHYVGEFVNASPFRRASLHAKRGLRRTKGAITALPGIVKEVREGIPHVLALAGWGAKEASALLPGLTKAWSDLLARAVTPPEVVEEAIARTEATAPKRTVREGRAPLPMHP